MTYYFNTIVSGHFDAIINRVTESLKKEGFGVLTQIDMQQTLKKKLNVDFKKYTILGACNPSFAYQSLQVENKIGTMLPCNVIVQELDNNTIEVSSINPLASMQNIKNAELIKIATTVSNKLENVINSLKNEE